MYLHNKPQRVEVYNDVIVLRCMEPTNTKANPTVKALLDIKHNLHSLRAALKAGHIQDVIDSLNYEEGRIDTLIIFNN